MIRPRRWQERIGRALEGLPGGPWLLPRDQWIAVWKDDGAQRTFLLVLVCLAGVIGSLLRFSLMSVVSALGCLALGLLLWRLMLYEVRWYFEAAIRFDTEARVDGPTLVTKVDWLHFDPPVWLRSGDAYWTQGRTLHIRHADGTERQVEARQRRPGDLG